MKFIFKSHQVDKSSSQEHSVENVNPKQRRREQVRRAQKTHRERKEAYTKSLESEVNILRTNETRILREVNTLQSKVLSLERLLLDHGIPIPQTPGPISSPADIGNVTFDLSIQKCKSKNRNKRIYMHLEHHQSPESQTEMSDSSAFSPESMTNTAVPPQRSLFSRRNKEESYEASCIEDLSSSLHSALLPSSAPLPTPARLCDLDQSILGLDFVLALEGPCLKHTQVNHGHHGLMISATLLHQQPSSQKVTSSFFHSTTVTQSHEPDADVHAWQLSHVGIERLLEIARGIPLEGEITPVQAWDYVRRREGFAGWDVGAFEGFRERCVGRIKCYGFGAVINQYDFERMVDEVFGPEMGIGIGF
ncbi:hypothetical protein B0J11DRAFT_493165 [Dendryphion nanum]|uniref:BZIP domain-containing protein n=1 Tax=Dendryphion nanum TaxID=256645 RepID=A0A9P9DEP1_9PLEO|nr:hypothetical protein B0J11DRAFT_493165 [Dendryphion nanum]